jgi:hypothetical protein
VVTRNVNGFQGVRTPRHQIHHRVGALVEPYCDLGEVETIRKAQQSACDREDPPEDIQIEGSGEFR